MKICLVSVFRSYYRCKNGRVCVRLGLYGRKEQDYFLSTKQFQQFEQCFDIDDLPVYSTVKNQVYAVIDGDRLIWVDNNPSWLLEKFNAEWDENSGIQWDAEKHKPFPLLAVPENIKIAEELLDD